MATAMYWQNKTKNLGTLVLLAVIFFLRTQDMVALQSLSEE